MAATTTEAIVLQVHSYGETSKIVRILTDSLGLRSAIARGALRPGSRYGRLLEPFSEGTATLHLKETREIQTLSGFEPTRRNRGLGADLVRFGAASLLAEVVLRNAAEEPHPGLYATTRTALHVLEAAVPEELEALALSRLWLLIGVLGYSPELTDCVGCGASLAVEVSGRFDYAAGGIRCARCSEGAPGPTIPPEARSALQSLCDGRAVALGETRGHWRLILRFLDYHLLEGRPLRSIPFLEDALAAGSGWPATGAVGA